MQRRQQYNATRLKCTVRGCERWFKNLSGSTKHFRSCHGPLAAMRSGSRHHYQQVSSSSPGSDGRRHGIDADDIPLVDQSSEPSSRRSSVLLQDSDPSLQYPPLPDERSPSRDPWVSSPMLQGQWHHPSSPGSPHSCSPHLSPGLIPEGTDASGFKIYHPLINGRPCDEQGNYLPPDTPPPPRCPDRTPDDWTPFRDRIEFETAELLYCRIQMSAPNINTLMDLWAATLLKYDDAPPFAGASDLYNTIDSTPLGDVPWKRFSVGYSGELPDGTVPQWMTSEYEIWFRDPHLIIKSMIGNPDYEKSVNTAPFQGFDSNGYREYQNFMSGDWAWEEADEIAKDPESHGAMLVPIILGSDKTTVSVMTGNNEYYPLYGSIGNVHNNVRRAHRGAVALIAFLAIPKTDKSYADDAKFRKFRRQLFHSSLSRILANFKPGMTTPEVVRCFDNHFRRVIYSLGSYIADYPEQCLLTCVVQRWCPRCTAKRGNLDGGGGRRSREHTELLMNKFELGVLWDEYGLVGDVVPFTNDFPRADIHKIIAPDLLHQLIKGTFKDHLVTWVGGYLFATHGEAHANQILDDIDRRIAAAPPFSDLRRFPQGRGFKQWTGDDSKALMKVYLPAIEGHVPRDMLRAFRAFLEFCYIARHNIITEKTLTQLQGALDRFHQYRTVFEDLGICPDGCAIPRQHSLPHYLELIRAFGAPNGLCSSITESKHIKAIKEPWRRSSHYKALGQMLLTNQRLDKLAAVRVDFSTRGCLKEHAYLTNLKPCLLRDTLEVEMTPTMLVI